MSHSGTTPCSQVLARLWEYLDEELGPEQAAEIRAHVDACGRCHRHYDLDRAYLRCLQRAAGEMDVPPAVRGRIRELILREGGPEPTGG